MKEREIKVIVKSEMNDDQFEDIKIKLEEYLNCEYFPFMFEIKVK